MKLKYCIFVLILIFIAGCAQEPQQLPQEPEPRYGMGCIGGLSCFDDLEASLSDEDPAIAAEAMAEYHERFYRLIEGFGIENYELTCTECDMGRGGYIRAQGVSNEIPFEVYLDWGWCSSSGSDCGHSEGLTTEDDTLFENVKQDICSELDSFRIGNETTTTCLGEEEYDDSEEVRAACFAGAYEKIEGNKKTICVNQISNRCSSSVESCIEE